MGNTTNTQVTIDESTFQPLPQQPQPQSRPNVTIDESTFQPLPQGSQPTQTQPPPPSRVGPYGQPNPNNVYAAAPDESTPQGAAAAIARREAQHPILSGIGKGAESLLQPVFHPIDTVESLVKQSLPPFQVYDSVKRAYPLIQAYENARTQGKSVWQSIAATNDLAAKQDAAHQLVEKTIADYKKNPTQTTAKLLTQAAGTVALLAAGGMSAATEAEVPAAATAAAEETPAVAAESVTSEPGIVQQVLKGEKVAQPGAQAAVRSGVQSSVDSANASAVAREAAANAPTETVKIPDEYKSLVDEALKQEPAWTPAKAQPVVKALGDNFELRGSVAEGNASDNDLDIWQKSGKLSDASDDLKNLGFKRVGKTPHGETWTNEATGQNVDLWDSAHEPKAGLGADTETEITSDEPAPSTSRKSPDVGDAPILHGRKSIVDDHLSTLAENEKAAYREMDDTAGFDIKAERQTLSNDKYKLAQLGNTDTDIAQRGKLIESINDSEDRIAAAEQKMKDAGVDPSLADSLHKQRMAGQDFRKSLIKNTNPDGSVNIKGLWKDTKAMRTSEYGDRLEQFFGSKEAADEYQAKLVAMDKLGAQALTRQRIAKLVGGYLAYKLGGHLFGMATNAAINVP
jgi:hypothetical protein